MPGKSRKKFKNTVQNKKQGGQAKPAVTTQPIEAAGISQAAAISTSPSAAVKAAPEPTRAAPSRPARTALPNSRAASIRTQFVGIELRNIGILAVVMLILLFVIARVLA